MDLREKLLGLQEGEPIAAIATNGDVLRGLIDEIAPDLDLLWICEKGTGARRLVLLGDLDDLKRGRHY